jgi:small basic protein
LFLIPVLALIIGIVLGRVLLSDTPVTGVAAVYLGVTILAGLDSVFGGLKSAMAGDFRTDVFLSGFVTNMLIAGFFAWFGDRIGVNLYLAAVLVMGWRIFTNLGVIRRQIIAQIVETRRRRMVEQEGASL